MSDDELARIGLYEPTSTIYDVSNDLLYKPQMQSEKIAFQKTNPIDNLFSYTMNVNG
jgi:hypothetical protein